MKENERKSENPNKGEENKRRFDQEITNERERRKERRWEEERMKRRREDERE